MRAENQLRSSDFGGSLEKYGCTRSQASSVSSGLPAAAAAPFSSKPLPARSRIQSSRRALPGPVSKARSRLPESMKVTFATPPTLRIANGGFSPEAWARARWNTGTSGAPCPPSATSAARKS